MRRRLGLLPAAVLLAFCCAGCIGSALSAFTFGLKEEECIDNFPVCLITAGCVLDDADSSGGEYLVGNFPEARRIIVRTSGEATVRVIILFTEPQASGTETDIRWYEPGCTFSYHYNSGGEDIFRNLNDDLTFVQEKIVRHAGDHLIEYYSDAVSGYALKVEVEPLEES